MKVLVLSILLVCLSTLCLGELKKYDGYKVLRINLENNSQIQQIQVLSDKLLADVWAVNPQEGWVDVMVSPAQERPFARRFPNHQIHIEDVQATLEEHYEEMANRSLVGDVFDSFPTNGEVVQWVNEQIAAHPNLASRVVIGQTYLGTDILGVKLSTGSNQPLVYIHCTIHAREWITTTTCLWIVDNLLTQDPDGARLLELYDWIIVPVFNIDGYDYTRTNDRLWRKNRMPNTGSTCYGTDVNRNYAYGWGNNDGSSPSPCAETYRGTGPFSTWEADAERSFLDNYVATLRYYVDIHSYGAYFMSAWGYTYSLPPDYTQMQSAMSRSVAAIRTVNNRIYTAGSSSNVLYTTSGSTVDYIYGNWGVVNAYTIEAFGSSFTAPVSYIRPIGREIYSGIKALVLQ